VAARLAAEEQQVLPTLRREIPQAHRVERVAPHEKTADWRPPLLGGRQARATFRQALFALQELLWDRRARAFSAPGRKL
jgi:hypothetical protein